MGPESLEVTRTSLSPNCASLCKGSSCNPYGLSKGLLVKSRWCLTSISWTTFTSFLATSHLHMSNGKLSFNVVSPRCKHNPAILFTYRNFFHTLNHTQQIYFILFYFIFFFKKNPVNSVHETMSMNSDPNSDCKQCTESKLGRVYSAHTQGTQAARALLPGHAHAAR